MRWTIATRIGLGVALPLLALLGIGALSYRTLEDLREQNRLVLHTHRVLESMSQLHASLVDAETGERGFALTGDERFLEPFNEGLRTAAAEQKQLRSLVADPGVQRRLDALERAVADRLAWSKDGVEVRRQQGLEAAVKRVSSGEGKRLMDGVRAILTAVDEAERDLLRRRSAAADAAAQRTSSAILYGTVAAFLVVSALAFFLARGVTTQIRDAVNVLASSAGEAVAATAQQAASAAQEMTAVQETTATVEELRQTVLMTAQKMRAVADEAQKTAQLSQDGRRSVDKCLEGLHEVKARMEALAERIVALSEQSQAIGEIISTVSDLADQSNLLAVNAAIEAAKAGDAGRGFSVVAGEVKSLADQSKQAAAQVRVILNDIQRATQSAVIAAEQAVKTSEAGVALAGDSGATIAGLADSVHGAAQAAQQVLASGQQQSIGMDQIATAMRSIQQSSSQTMAGARQVDRAARDLSALARRLKAMVDSNGASPAPFDGRAAVAAGSDRGGEA
jgi:methyl-accepting chemotaxis protein